MAFANCEMLKYVPFCAVRTQGRNGEYRCKTQQIADMIFVPQFLANYRPGSPRKPPVLAAHLVDTPKRPHVHNCLIRLVLPSGIACEMGLIM